MNVLTESMSRLRGEILVARHRRKTFRSELVSRTRARQLMVFELLSAFAGDRAGARRSWQGSASGPPLVTAAAPTQPNKRKAHVKHS